VKYREEHAENFQSKDRYCAKISTCLVCKISLLKYLWCTHKKTGYKLYYSSQYIEIVRLTLLGLFLFAATVQLIYYIFLYCKVAGYRRAPQLKKYPVSVIICAKNEAENLRNNLPAILTQKHKNYEVIVVNDCSTDDTDEVLGEYIKNYHNLRTTSITPDKKFTHGKKLAITVGIKAAQNEWLVFIDADCYPVSDQWLNRLQENFTDKNEIVLGYGGYSSRKGLLNIYIRYDTLVIAMQYMSYAISGMPYMGVGRNLAYRKSLFFKNKGFASHYDLLSGDDDLFVNETANKVNTAVEFHPESHTLSIPKMRWSDWVKQKKRHFSTAKRYRANHIFWLGFEPMTRFLFYVTLCYLLSLNIFPILVLIVAGSRLLVQLIIIKLTMHRFRERDLLLWAVIFDIISLFINFNIYLSSIFRRKKSGWK
jgi:biofilm PGA synthesis N-glycosyltransferase PgaC